GMTAEEIRARPVPGKWSTLEVVAHIADFEPVYACRIKRILAEENATLLSGDPDLFAARLKYDLRDLEEELSLIDATRRHITRILRNCAESDFARTGTPSSEGPLSLGEVLRRIAEHIPHHVRFIQEKREALARG